VEETFADLGKKTQKTQKPQTLSPLKVIDPKNRYL